MLHRFLRPARILTLVSTVLGVGPGVPGAQQLSGVRSFGPAERAPAPLRGSADGTVGPNVNVTQDFGAQNETSIDADPLVPQSLVAGTNDYRFGDSQAGVACSFDGGQTWTASTLAALDPSLGKYGVQGDPAIAAYGGGVYYYAFIDFDRFTDQNRLAVARSNDGGVTWPVLGVIIDHEGPGPHDTEDKEYVAVDDTGGPFDGNVYVSWTRFPPGFATTHIQFTRSTDGGASFSAPVEIGDDTFGNQGSVPAVGPNGEVYVAWKNGSQIVIDKSTDGGVTFGTDVVVANISPMSFPLPGAFFRGNSFPTIAVDTTGGPGNGNVYVAWADQTGVAGSGPDVLCSRSTDGGATWSAPVRVSDDANGSYQFFPWLSVAPDGAVHAVFFDRRDNPNTGLYHTYVAVSNDAGASFEPSVRVSEEVSNSFNDGFGGGFIGDYNGITTTSTNVAYPFWTDVRDANANAEGYTTAVGTPSEGLSLSITGACPGQVLVQISGATPGQSVAMAASFAPGAFTVAHGPCTGTVLGLDDARLLAVLTADQNGAFSFSANVASIACNLLFQAVDLTTCEASGVVPMP